MQKYKFVMREVGVGEGMWNADELESYLENNVASQGYEILSSHITDLYKDNVYIGFRATLTFVKNQEVKVKEAKPKTE